MAWRAQCLVELQLCVSARGRNSRASSKGQRLACCHAPAAAPRPFLTSAYTAQTWPAAVADIVRLVESAQSRTAPVQRFADVVAVGRGPPGKDWAYRVAYCRSRHRFHRLPSA